MEEDPPTSSTEPTNLPTPDTVIQPAAAPVEPIAEPAAIVPEASGPAEPKVATPANTTIEPTEIVEPAPAPVIGNLVDKPAVATAEVVPTPAAPSANTEGMPAGAVVIEAPVSESSSAESGSVVSTLVPDGSPSVGKDTASAPGMIYSHNSLARAKEGKMRKLKMVVFFVILPIILGAAGYTYFWMLPAKYADTYLSTVKPAYSDQSGKMKVVYDSFSRSVFSVDDNPPASDKKDLDEVKPMIDAAISSTSTLKSKNHLKVLPGTAWLHKVADTNKKYKAMQQYVTDSGKLLNDYQALTTYISKVDDIQVADNDQLALGLEKAVAVLSDRSLAAADLDAKTALAALTPIVASFKQLQVPADVKQDQDAGVGAIDGVISALNEIDAGISTGTPNQITSGAAHLQQAFTTLDNLDKTTGQADHLQHDSSIHQQITALQAAKPLN